MSVNYPRNSCTPIETYGLIADYDPGEDAYDILATFQGPFSIHAVLARALKVPGNRLRLRMPPDAGGSFGVKQGIFPYIALMGIAARVAGRPVKWIEDRLEHLTASVSATNRLITLEAAVEADGRVTALAWDQVEDVGAHIRAPEPATLYRMHGNLTGAYDIRNVSVRNRVVLTNKTPTGLNRGFGGPQVYYALERLMQRVAVELKLDPLDVIRRNLVPSGVFPFRTATGGLLDSGDYPACVAQAVEEGGLAELRARQKAARARGPALRHRPHRRGRAERLEHGLHHHRADARGAAQGRAEERRAGDRHDCARSGRRGVGACRVGAAGPGPSHRGGADRRRRARAEAVRHPRRHRHGHGARRLVDRVGQLCQPLRARGRRRGAARGRADRSRSSRAPRPASSTCRRTRSSSRAGACARRAIRTMRCRSGASPRRRTGRPARSPTDDAALRETVFWTPPQLTAPTEDDGINSSLCHGFIFDFCGVEVDRMTGAVRIDKYVTMHDCGRVLHPGMVAGQVTGGFAHALGAALYEEYAYADDGSFISGTFADYLLPTTTEVPAPLILHFESPSPFTPLGAKGVGEGNCMSTPVCIANAVADALGVAELDLPLTPAKLAALIT